VDREDWNARYAGRAYVWDVIPSRLLENEIQDLAPGRALDLGCGEGRNTVWLASRGWRVTGVDFSEAGLDKARALARRHGVRVRWLLRDLAGYRPRARHYDLVLMCYLQVPRDELTHIVARAAAAVKPGGTFVYIGHDLSNLAHGHGGPRDPAVLCTPADITAMLPRFRVRRAEVVQRAVDSEPGHGGQPGAVALDAVVRAARLE
jgi:SAM-dependent methyltransferase